MSALQPGEPNNTEIQALECTLLPFLFAIPCKFSARIYSPRRLATLWCTSCTSAVFALEWPMPTVRRFSRCRIEMYFGDHPPPHFHVITRSGEKVVFRIDS